MSDTINNIQQIDLMRLVRALIRRFWAVILIMALCGAAAFGYSSHFITPLYQSSVLLYVNNSSFTVGSSSVSVGDLTTSSRLVDTYIVILQTRMTLNEVIERADLHYSYGTLRSMISAAAINETEVFSVTVTGPNPEEAALIANTIAEVLPEQVAKVVDGSSMRTVDYAVVPRSKISPNVTGYTTRGIMAGFVLGCALIILLELFDDVIHDEDTLASAYGISVLAAVPDLRDKGGKGGYYSSYYEAAKVER